MTTNNTASKFNLPTHTVTADELHQSMPKAKRVRAISFEQSAVPTPELIAELSELLGHLSPDDPNPAFSWKRVVIVIFYETAGHPDGFVLANTWLSMSRSYKGTGRALKFWKGMKPCPRNPLTVRTLRWMVDQRLTKI